MNNALLIYAKAVNKIDDFFEYRYKNHTKEEIRQIVVYIIDNEITKKLNTGNQDEKSDK